MSWTPRLPTPGLRYCCCCCCLCRCHLVCAGCWRTFKIQEIQNSRTLFSVKVAYTVQTAKNKHSWQIKERAAGTYKRETAEEEGMVWRQQQQSERRRRRRRRRGEGRGCQVTSCLTGFISPQGRPATRHRKYPNYTCTSCPSVTTTHHPLLLLLPRTLNPPPIQSG